MQSMKQLAKICVYHYLETLFGLTLTCNRSVDAEWGQNKMALLYILFCGLLILRVANGMTNFSSYLRIVGNVYLKCVVDLSTSICFLCRGKCKNYN